MKLDDESEIIDKIVARRAREWSTIADLKRPLKQLPNDQDIRIYAPPSIHVSGVEDCDCSRNQLQTVRGQDCDNQAYDQELGDEEAGRTIERHSTAVKESFVYIQARVASHGMLAPAA